MATKRSYQLKFGINDSEVAEQLANIDKSLKNTHSEAKLLKTALSNGWDAEKWVQAKQTAAKAVEDTAKKVELLKQRLREMEADGSAETNADQFRALQKEILAAENAAAKAKAELQKINALRMEEIAKQLESVEQKLTSIGKTMTVAVTTPIVAGGTAAVAAYSDMAESINKVETAFGSAAGGVMDFSEKTLTTYGIAKSTALDMAAGFGDMATSMGYSQSAAADMAQELVGLAGDLASFKNISLGEAQTALTAIFTGETESLKRLGVVMTEVNLNEYALANGIKTKYNEMTQAEKVQLRYQYVMENTANSQGDFAKTSESTANQLRILQESLKELAAVAGEEVAPMVTPIIAKLNDMIQSIGELDDGTKKAIVQAATFAATLGPLLTVTGKMTGGVATLVTACKKLKPALTAATASQTALNAAQSASPAGALAKVISVLVSILGSAAITAALTAEKTETLSDKIEKTVENYEDAIAAIDESTTSQEAEVAIVERLAERYDDLNGKVGEDESKKAELASVVEQINSKLGTEISLIDEETGQYSLSTEEIRKNIQARKDLIEAQAYEKKALEAKDAMIELESQMIEAYGTDDVDTLKKMAEQFDEGASKAAEEHRAMQNYLQEHGLAGLPEMEAATNWLDDIFGWSKVEALKSEGETAAEIRKAVSEYEELSKKFDEYYKKSSTTTGGNEDGGGNKDDPFKKLREELAAREAAAAAEEARKKAAEAAEKAAKEAAEAAEKAAKEEAAAAEKAAKEATAAAEKAAEEERKKVEEQRDKELADIEWYYNSRQISQQEYLKRIAAFRDKWFEEDTEEWRRYTLQIAQMQEEIAEAEARAQEERVKAYQEASDAIVSAAEEEANAKIKAIDEELAARNRLKEEREQERRLQEAMAELAFTRDEDSRASLKREIASLQESIAEQQIAVAAESEKSRIQAEVAQIKALAEQRVQSVSAAVLGTQQAAANPYLPSFVVNAQGLTVEQAADMIERAYKRIMYGR